MKFCWDLVFGRSERYSKSALLVSWSLISPLKAFTVQFTIFQSYQTVWRLEHHMTFMTLMFGVWCMTYDIWWLVTDMKYVLKPNWWTHVPNFDEINNFYPNTVVKIGVSISKVPECVANISLTHWFWLNNFRKIEKLFWKYLKLNEAKTQNRNDFSHRFNGFAVRNKIHRIQKYFN